MITLNQYEAWFITGSQHLYGEETLEKVSLHAKEISEALNHHQNIPVKIVFKDILTSSEDIYQMILEANSNANCIGLIAWMHTFSPAKMWINGLKILQKPMLHLHTQYNQQIPWGEIDMDFMNLNQSAHGGREFGFIGSRMNINRKVVVGHWQDIEVIDRINIWLRVACGKQDLQGARFARLGDNMRQVAVTEGDKVEAEIKFGYSVNGYGLGDLGRFVEEVQNPQIEELLDEYRDSYQISKELVHHQALKEAARIELGLKNFLIDGGFKGFTDTFENLHGLVQLPGLAVQRLMAEGYGFGAEGDWKTAALVRLMKVMGTGLSGGNSFMEDYTYHFNGKASSVLGSHMLEICPSIAKDRPSCEIHPLGIGGKADPVRLVFEAKAGAALNASIIDMGNRFRLLVNTVQAQKIEEDLPKLPVARVLWKPLPDLKTAATAWILAGGAHHTCYSESLTIEYLEDYAEMVGMEMVVIDENTQIRNFKNELRWNSMYFR